MDGRTVLTFNTVTNWYLTMTVTLTYDLDFDMWPWRAMFFNLVNLTLSYDLELERQGTRCGLAAAEASRSLADTYTVSDSCMILRPSTSRSWWFWSRSYFLIDNKTAMSRLVHWLCNVWYSRERRSWAGRGRVPSSWQPILINGSVTLHGNWHIGAQLTSTYPTARQDNRRARLSDTEWRCDGRPTDHTA